MKQLLFLLRQECQTQFRNTSRKIKHWLFDNEEKNWQDNQFDHRLSTYWCLDKRTMLIFHQKTYYFRKKSQTDAVRSFYINTFAWKLLKLYTYTINLGKSERNLNREKIAFELRQMFRLYWLQWILNSDSHKTHMLTPTTICTAQITHFRNRFSIRIPTVFFTRVRRVLLFRRELHRDD